MSCTPWHLLGWLEIPRRMCPQEVCRAAYAHDEASGSRALDELAQLGPERAEAAGNLLRAAHLYLGAACRLPPAA